MALGNAIDTASNAWEFAGQIEKFAKGVDIEAVKVMKRVTFQVFRGVVEKTPVDTGVARASWVVGVGKKHPYYIAALGSTAQMPNFNWKFYAGRALKVVISNYVPYIHELEHGSSQQAPHGMAQITVNEVMAELRSLSDNIDDL